MPISLSTDASSRKFPAVFTVFLFSALAVGPCVFAETSTAGPTQTSPSIQPPADHPADPATPSDAPSKDPSISPTVQSEIDHNFTPPPEPAFEPGRQPGAVTARPLASVCNMVNFGDPNHPNGPLWPGSINAIAEGKGDHNLYSTSPSGGKYGRGTVFKVTLDGQLSVLHDFDFKTGSGPMGGLMCDPDGYFYGTTYTGGEHGVGTVFSVPPGGGHASVMTNFRNGKPARKLRRDEKDYTEQEKLDWGGSYPVSPPVQGADGQLYAVTSYSNNQQYGIFYRVGGDIPHGIQRFDGISVGLYASSVFAALDGNIYGVSWHGKRGNPHGMIFRGPGIQPVHYFDYPLGSGPVAVMLADNNRLYGTTVMGGPGPSPGNGVIYSMNPDGSDYKVIHFFTGGQDGAASFGQLVQGKDHKLYGAARYGGVGRGTLFRIDLDGNNFEVLHKFHMYDTGRSPMSNLLAHSDGNFYGLTYQGGKFDKGVVYRLNVHPTPYEKLFAPSRRYCCSLGQGGEAYGGQSLDPDQLSGHVYGVQDRLALQSITDPFGTALHDPIGGPVGYVYTLHGGLVDIGHVRDMADLTKYLYDMLMAGETAFYLYEGAVLVTHPPTDQFEALDLAGAVAWVEGWAHELTTWGDPKQDFSSFSPEDLSSNIVGIELGKRAIARDCLMDFNKAVDKEMPVMMKELGAQSKFTTQKLRAGIESYTNTLLGTDGVWFYENARIFETLIRRNFYGRVWKLMPDLDRFVPFWLTPGWFTKQYGNFKYAIGKPVRGRDGVTLLNMPAATETLRKEWVAQHPKMDQWPYYY